jgi:hypothetical protein
MPSITSWTRLEPRTRREDLEDSLAARIHDPLWQLARQWQIGEFTAEDAGSPVQARVRIEHAPLTRYRAGATGTGTSYDAKRMPLETLVEREAALAGTGAVPSAQLAAVAGLHFLRLLARHGMGKYRSAYVARYALAVPANDARLDAAGRRFLAVMGGRVPDGVRLRAELAPALGVQTPALPAEPPIAAGDRGAVITAGREWLAWYASHASEPQGSSAAAWQSDRMEYAFAVAAPTATGEVVLAAPEYAEGSLDWEAFDRQVGASLGANADRSAFAVVTRTVIPTPVTYRGMPAARWWEFEEAEVNFGSIDAEPTDLMRLLLLGFALDFGNDWFVLPVDLDAGSVSRVRSLVVTDTFGQRTLVRPYAQVDAPRRDWRLFCAESPAPPSTADDTAELLFLAPAVVGGLDGEPIEEVLLLRDELANLAWAVERVVESATGGRLDRFEAYRAKPAAPPSPAGGNDKVLRYRLSTTVPDYWLPLVPVRIDAARPDIRLRRGRVLLDRDGQPTTPSALGRVLEPGTQLSLYEEEVPRAGVRIARAWQYARWVDGSTHLWVGRRKGPGRGEGWSGLRFDVVEPL